MEKIFWFIFIVILGTGLILILSSQSTKTNGGSIITPTPTLTLDVPPVKNTSLSPALNLSPTPNISSSANEKKITRGIIKTTKGDIKIAFYQEEAPNTVNNFANKAKSGFYNNLTFHRVEDWVVQGGDPKGNGTGGGQMKTELNDKPFILGSIGVARGQDIQVSNDSQFFITKKESSWLNKQYTNFGIVTDGMDVVDKIEIGDKILGITIE